MDKDDFIEEIKSFCDEEHIKFSFYYDIDLKVYSIKLEKENKGVKKSIRRKFSIIEIENTSKNNLMAIIYRLTQQLYDSIQNEVYRV